MIMSGSLIVFILFVSKALLYPSVASEFPVTTSKSAEWERIGKNGIYISE